MQKNRPSYEDGIEHWLCPTCRLWQVRSNFYKDKRTGNGLKSQCKKCHNITTIESRDKENSRRINREHMRRARVSNPEKFRIRDILQSKK